MTLGQMSEIAVLALIPLIAKSVSRKHLLIVGCAAYALRMALFAWVHHLPDGARLPALMAGVALHGVCFGCFIFLAFMIVDEETSADVRASAQSLYNLVIVGLGIIIGSWLSGAVATWAARGNESIDYADPSQTQALFAVPMWASLGCLVLVVVLYPSNSRKSPVDQQDVAGLRRV
jgi:MFS family permease